MVSCSRRSSAGFCSAGHGAAAKQRLLIRSDEPGRCTPFKAAFSSHRESADGMFGLGTPELAVIGVVVMFVLGPDQMKSMAKEVARVGVQLKQVPEEFNKGIEDGKQLAASELADEDKKAKELLARERAKDPLA